MLRSIAAVFSLVFATGCGEGPPTGDDTGPTLKELVPTPAGAPSVLVFTRTSGFRHDSIPAGLQALTTLAQQHGFGLSNTEDATRFTDAVLAQFAAVIFLSTTGEILLADQEAAFERYMAAGHGYVGVHAAADCEYNWPFYGKLVGAYFKGHSLPTSAQVKVEPVTHPSLTGLSSPWTRTDEWYGFATNPRPDVTVLLTVDETTFAPEGGEMGADHPVAWYHTNVGGRAFYTALGHTRESFSEPQFLAHLLGGIQWATGVAQ
ncbi:MAG TPA: ThuA domain-containing protein [Polyangiaceae bacterium]|nr:ThuA domain-containing protein [Polyangiaceae bacterium]